MGILRFVPSDYIIPSRAVYPGRKKKQMTNKKIEALAKEIREAATWTEELLKKLFVLTEESGLNLGCYVETYVLCKDIQDALGIDLGE